MINLSGSNNPYLEQISMVPKMFEPLKFDCKQILKGMTFDINEATKTTRKKRWSAKFSGPF